MSSETLFMRLGVALGLGLLVGMQRERAKTGVAGLRTFALVTVMGFFCGLMTSQPGGLWLLPAGLVALAIYVPLGRQHRQHDEASPHGLTTLSALLFMFVLGAYLPVGEISLALVAAAGVAVLLEMKGPLHALVNRLNTDEYQAITRFVLLALVVLPVLPNRAYGPFDVLNPFEIWLMVVLIVGISLGGYLGFKLFGARGGALVAGLLGGVISSTATTLSYARRSRENPALCGLGVVVVMLASSVVFVRLGLEIVVVAPDFFKTAAPPMAAMGAAMLLLCAVAWLVAKPSGPVSAEEGDLAQMNAALAFGLLYAVILFSVAATKEYFGDEGLYVVAVLSGLTDVDAITLSTSNLVKNGKLPPGTGWRLVMVAALSNLAFKGVLAAMLGARQMGLKLLGFFAAAVAGGLGIVFLWR